MPLPRSRSFIRMPPSSLGCCERCGFNYYHSELQWQFEYLGPSLQNKYILVCTRTCLDVPQPQLKPIILPPDPMPIQNPRTNPNMVTISD